MKREGRPPSGAALASSYGFGDYALRTLLACSLPFWPVRDVEDDGLALVEGLEALALDLAEVHEDVVAVLTRDEAVALVRIEPLHSTFSHVPTDPSALDGAKRGRHDDPDSCCTALACKG